MILFFAIVLIGTILIPFGGGPDVPSPPPEEPDDETDVDAEELKRKRRLLNRRRRGRSSLVIDPDAGTNTPGGNDSGTGLSIPNG